MTAGREAQDRATSRLLWVAALGPIGLVAVLRILAIYVQPGLASIFLLLQDRWLPFVQIAIAAAAFLPIPARTARLRLSGIAVGALAAGLAAVCYAGHRWLLMGYDLSRDEQMASFDARIFASGRLVQPLPTSWQGDADTLNTLFMLPVSHPVAWVSGYLPGNAMLRAAMSLLGDAALTGPLLNAIALVVLWRCARLLWPDDDEAVAIPVLMVALSGQVIMAGMTAYAMPAHLCCNLVWLWLFLQNRRRADFAALAVGFLATGLHQPLFHPLFVAPWLCLLLAERDWRRLAPFAIGYALIGAFWLGWPMWIHAMIVGPHSLSDAGTDYLTRLTTTLKYENDNGPLMAENLLRFCNWQPVALLPLLVAGWVVARQDRRAGALAAGFILPIALLAFILPYQGHGFGYRYVHGVLGNTALLAGYGWQRLEPWHDRLRPMLVRAIAGSALVLLPVEGWMAHMLYRPFAQANARINALHTDYVIIGSEDGPYTLDLVLNRPDLSNRPIRLVAGEIDDIDELSQRICRGSGGAPVNIALPRDSFFTDITTSFGAPPSHDADKRFAEQADEFADAGCTVTQLK